MSDERELRKRIKYEQKRMRKPSEAKRRTSTSETKEENVSEVEIPSGPRPPYLSSKSRT